MSTLFSLFSEWFGALRREAYELLPRRCIVCHEPLLYNQYGVCVKCHLDVPYTNNLTNHYSPINTMSLALQPQLKHVSALFYYVRGSRWQRLIHNYKYRNNWQYGATLGRWMGGVLRRSEIYRDIDVVIPIPLHRARYFKRGYNQSELLAKYIAEELCAEFIPNALVRVRNNRPQVTRTSQERWDFMNDLFDLPDPQLLEGRNVLLVDDVFTTGATIISASNTILDRTTSCNVYISTLAQSNYLR